MIGPVPLSPGAKTSAGEIPQLYECWSIVNLQFGPQAPLLVVVEQDQIFWRFSIVFSMGPRGRLGQVGEIDVDARILAQGAALPANN